jgi:hypothetical protein
MLSAAGCCGLRRQPGRFRLSHLSNPGDSTAVDATAVDFRLRRSVRLDRPRTTNPADSRSHLAVRSAGTAAPFRRLIVFSLDPRQLRYLHACCHVCRNRRRAWNSVVRCFALVRDTYWRSARKKLRRLREQGRKRSDQYRCPRARPAKRSDFTQFSHDDVHLISHAARQPRATCVYAR